MPSRATAPARMKHDVTHAHSKRRLTFPSLVAQAHRLWVEPSAVPTAP
jgi:hypothetical protein